MANGATSRFFTSLEASKSVIQGYKPVADGAFISSAEHFSVHAVQKKLTVPGIFFPQDSGKIINHAKSNAFPDQTYPEA